MNYILSAILCIILVEIGIRLPFPQVIAQVSRAGGKATHVLRVAGVSDHWKEKAMSAYAGRMFLATMKLAGCLVVIIAAASVVALIFDMIAPGFSGFLLGWLGIASTLVFATLYYTARQKVLHGRVQ